MKNRNDGFVKSPPFDRLRVTIVMVSLSNHARLAYELFTKPSVICGFVLAVVFTCAGCSSSSSSSGLDRGKFNGVNIAAQQVRETISSRAGYKTFDTALQKLLAEMAALKEKARTDQEKDLLKDYSDLCAIYQDGSTLWKYKLEYTRYGFVPKNLIYVNQDIDPIVVKYRIPVEYHIYAPTQQSWKSIPDESIQMIWTNADSEMQIINNILNYK